MNYIKIIGTPLYQWESGRKIQIIPLPKMHINAVHFSNYGDAEALVVIPREENGNIIADIPNILLQSGRNIVVYTVNVAEDSVETLVECTISVRNRAKPADYVYTETEIYTIKTAVDKALLEAKESGEFQGEKGDPGVSVSHEWKGTVLEITSAAGTSSADLKGEKGNKGDPGKDVDYSLVANALKGYASGNPIIIDDSSPLEHEMKVKAASGSTVTKYGKNLLSFENFEYETNSSKITWENGLFRLEQKATATSSNVISLTQTANYYNGVEIFPAGTYFFTADPIETLVGRKVNPILRCAFTDGSGECTIEANKPVTASKPFEIKAVITSSVDREKGYVYECRWQLECGSVGTDFELFKPGETHTADENGNVGGIMANGEAMTLIADTEAAISAEYNKDTNKVIESLVNAIISLGGEV